jgi:hypothetical protein
LDFIPYIFDKASFVNNLKLLGNEIINKIKPTKKEKDMQKENKTIKNQKTFFVNRFQKKRKINFNPKTKKEKKYFRTPPKKLSNINNKTYLNENKISSYLFTIDNSNLNNTIE